jgi:hypothetical protein
MPFGNFVVDDPALGISRLCTAVILNRRAALGGSTEDSLALQCYNECLLSIIMLYSKPSEQVQSPLVLKLSVAVSHHTGRLTVCSFSAVKL